MTRYIMTEKIAKILMARGYKLVCKMCTGPLHPGLSEKECKEKNRPNDIGDLIESKQQRGGRSKLYHAKCYDDSHIDVADKKWEKRNRGR